MAQDERSGKVFDKQNLVEPHKIICNRIVLKQTRGKRIVTRLVCFF